MPIKYEIDRGRGLVFRTFTGDITLDVLTGHYRDLLSDPELDGLLGWVSDMRHCVLDVRGEDVQRLVHSTIEPLIRGRHWHCAAVVNKGSQYGITNQFAVYSSAFGETKIFYDMDEAIEWASSRPAAGDSPEAGPIPGSAGTP